ncbi:Hypothetical protein CUL131002_0021c [Corynebacterium ulcerans]|nr:Hypothetical protein CUL131002_0021c [Corynebacterium ulcerans]
MMRKMMSVDKLSITVAGAWLYAARNVRWADIPPFSLKVEENPKYPKHGGRGTWGYVERFTP